MATISGDHSSPGRIAPLEARQTANEVQLAAMTANITALANSVSELRELLTASFDGFRKEIADLATKIYRRIDDHTKLDRESPFRWATIIFTLITFYGAIVYLFVSRELQRRDSDMGVMQQTAIDKGFSIVAGAMEKSQEFGRYLERTDRNTQDLTQLMARMDGRINGDRIRKEP